MKENINFAVPMPSAYPIEVTGRPKRFKVHFRNKEIVLTVRGHRVSVKDKPIIPTKGTRRMSWNGTLNQFYKFTRVPNGFLKEAFQSYLKNWYDEKSIFHF